MMHLASVLLLSSNITYH